MIRIFLLFLGFALVVNIVGCKPREETIEVKASNDPLHEPRSILQRYAEGQPLGSEVTTFPDLVANVKKVDAERGQILEKGFQDIQKASASERPEKAKSLLKKLAPSMSPAQ